jgi:hypothetical protein
MKTKGTIVWDYKQGWNSPELEVPATGKIAIFVDYPDDELSMPVIELGITNGWPETGFF